MKISTIKIEKFRSIKKASLTLNDMCALVGANNAGKSHVLRALNSFFNFEDEQESFFNGSHRYNKNARPTITIIFTEISENEVPNDYIHNKKLVIKFTYRWDRNRPTY